MSTSESDSNDEAEVRPYIYRERQIITDPTQFRERYRFTPRIFELLLREVGQRLQSSKNNLMAMKADQKLMVALRFYATNGEYYNDGDLHGFDKGSVCRAIRQVTSVVNETLQGTICWPQDENDNRRISREFHAMAGVPSICGVIDGTLIRVYVSGGIESQFVDRHNQHSINALAVCGPNHKFYFLSTKMAGSVHDARVLRLSALYEDFENGFRPFPNAVILGDSAYPLLDWLIPYSRHVDPQVARFYRQHAKTRRVIECTFGIFKQRFQCLLKGLRVKTPTYSAEIIKTCAYLHNFLIDHREAEENDDDDFERPVDLKESDNEKDEEVETSSGQERLQLLISQLTKQ
ncbi:putative nuclease HARBI1 [Aphelenchoides besseyi]|nr:putative nuclease HARBI1 [Aphelenchoides besseyi]